MALLISSSCQHGIILFVTVALIVDDNQFFLRMERLLLQRHGFEVATAEDGEEGYAVFQDHASRIDIVVTDLMMPKLSGTELCRRIKKKMPEMPVVLVTGIESERTRLHPEFDLVVYKPLEADFVNMLKNLVADSKRKRASAG